MQVEPVRNWIPTSYNPIVPSSAVSAVSPAAARLDGVEAEPVMAVVSAEWSAKASADYAAYLDMSPLKQSPAAVMQNPRTLDRDLPPSILGKIVKEAEQAYSAAAGTAALGGIEEIKECETCKNRMYVDDSSDPSVSFQAPTNIRPEEALARVAAHEGEHVANDQMQAKQDGGRVVSQTVTLSTSVCPECGRVYISGGETRTTVATPTEEQSEPELLELVE